MKEPIAKKTVKKTKSKPMTPGEALRVPKDRRIMTAESYKRRMHEEFYDEDSSKAA